MELLFQAFQLLKEKRTAHSQFGIPILIQPNSTCKIDPNSLAGSLLREAGIMVWDEVLMYSENDIKAADRLIKGYYEKEWNLR